LFLPKDVMRRAYKWIPFSRSSQELERKQSEPFGNAETSARSLVFNFLHLLLEEKLMFEAG